jgi:hypothetical protein
MGANGVFSSLVVMFLISQAHAERGRGSAPQATTAAAAATAAAGSANRAFEAQDEIWVS